MLLFLLVSYSCYLSSLFYLRCCACFLFSCCARFLFSLLCSLPFFVAILTSFFRCCAHFLFPSLCLLAFSRCYSHHFVITLLFKLLSLWCLATFLLSLLLLFIFIANFSLHFLFVAVLVAQLLFGLLLSSLISVLATLIVNFSLLFPLFSFDVYKVDWGAFKAIWCRRVTLLAQKEYEIIKKPWVLSCFFSIVSHHTNRNYSDHAQSPESI